MFKFFEKKRIFSGPHRKQFWKQIRSFFEKIPKWQNGSAKFKKFPKSFLWICNMQFRERSQKDFANVPKVLRLKSEKYQSIFLFLKPCFCQKVPLGSSNAKFGNCAGLFSTKVKDVFGQGPNIYRKDIGFSKKCFSSKERFFGNVKCSFDTPHEIFWPKTTVKMLAVSPKVMVKTRCVKNIFSFPKRSSGLIESSFDKRSELFLPKVRNR